MLAVSQLGRCDWRVLLRNCGAVLAFPVVAGCLIDSWAMGQPELSFSLYGSFALFFGALANAGALVAPSQAAPRLATNDG